MFGKSNTSAPPAKATIESSLQGLAAILAALVALGTAGQIFHVAFDPATSFFTARFGDASLGQLSAWTFVGLSTLAVYYLCRVIFALLFVLLAENLLVRFAL